VNRSTDAVVLTLAETRERGRQAGEVREGLVRMDLLGARQEHFLGLFVVRIGNAALHGAHRLARLVVEETDTFTAQLGIDHVDAVTFADGVVRTFRLARSAVDAFLGNMSSHCAPFARTLGSRGSPASETTEV